MYSQAVNNIAMDIKETKYGGGHLRDSDFINYYAAGTETGGNSR